MSSPGDTRIGRERGALPAIFSVFLGLMITAVVGVGVYTFLPDPSVKVQDQIDAVYAQRDDILGCGREPSATCRGYDQLSTAEKARIDALDGQATELRERADSQRQAWAQRTSIVLIVIATLLMVLSLVLADTLLVMSNGILLGGLFTMVYAVGWGIASGQGATRFFVLLLALVISVVLGYVRFVRPRRAGVDQRGEPTADVAPAPASTGAGLAELVARVEALETRLAAVAQLLAPPGGGRAGGTRHGGPPT